MTKKTYIPARIYQRLSIEMEGALLAGSVVEKMEVESAGQEVETFDFADTGFNHNWEE